MVPYYSTPEYANKNVFCYLKMIKINCFQKYKLS